MRSQISACRRVSDDTFHDCRAHLYLKVSLWRCAGCLVSHHLCTSVRSLIQVCHCLCDVDFSSFCCKSMVRALSRTRMWNHRATWHVLRLLLTSIARTLVFCLCLTLRAVCSMSQVATSGHADIRSWSAPCRYIRRKDRLEDGTGGSPLPAVCGGPAARVATDHCPRCPDRRTVAE